MRLISKLTTSAGVLALSTGFAAAAPAVVQQDLNLRAGPGPDYQVIAAMPAGTTVNVMGCQASWCRVDFAGTMGFASRGYLGLGGGVAVAPRYGYGESYAYGPGYAVGPRYGEGAYVTGGYSPGYSYGYAGTTGYGGGYGYYEGERSVGNERRVGEGTTIRGERANASANVSGSEQQRAAAIKGNNPMRIRQNEAAVANAPRPSAIKGNNPMRIRQNEAAVANAQQPTAIKGNNPMRIRRSTASSNAGASATTGAAPRENNRRQPQQ